MLVSKTETAISWSNRVDSMTSLAPRSNSSKSPIITKVSKESMSVKVKLRTRMMVVFLFHWGVFSVLSKDIIDVSSVMFHPTIATLAAQGHKLVGRKGIFHVSMICVKKHVSGLFPRYIRGNIGFYFSTNCTYLSCMRLEWEILEVASVQAMTNRRRRRDCCIMTVTKYHGFFGMITESQHE